MSALKIEGLYEIKGKVLRSSVLESGKSAARITVHMGTCGISSGAADILQVFKEELKSSKRKDISVTTSGCAGICNREPLITVERVGEEPVKYADVTKEKAREIFRSTWSRGKGCPSGFSRGGGTEGDGFRRAPFREDGEDPHTRDIPFFGMQNPVVMKNRD